MRDSAARLFTVGEVGVMSGVSVRTLHHYDAIGLLKPAHVGGNGYRYYDRDGLLRLQQILFHRELGFPLGEIAAILAAPDFDRAAALGAHRKRLRAEIQRHSRLIRTIDRTIRDLAGSNRMQDKSLYDGFAPPKQGEYEAYLVERFGEGGRTAIDGSRARLDGWTKTDFEGAQAELRTLEEAFAAAMGRGVPADAAEAQGLVARHHAWVRRFWTPDRDAYAGLGRLYTEHPDFLARYEGLRPGLAAYLAEAMAVYAERLPGGESGRASEGGA